MDCVETLLNISEYLDRRLAPATAQELERHFAGCRDCERRLREHRLLDSMLSGALPEAEPPAARMWQAIRVQLPLPQPVEAESFLSRLASLIRQHGLALAPIPVALLIFALFWSRPGGPQMVRHGGVDSTGIPKIHRSGPQRNIGEFNQQRWDYVDSGFHAYARKLRDRGVKR